MTSFGLLGYIDPGSGTLLLQAILAAGLGAVVCLRGAFGRVFGFVLRRRADETAGNESPQTGP